MIRKEEREEKRNEREKGLDTQREQRIHYTEAREGIVLERKRKKKKQATECPK